MLVKIILMLFIENTYKPVALGCFSFHFIQIIFLVKAMFLKLERYLFTFIES